MLSLSTTIALGLIGIPILAGQQLEGSYEPYEELGLSDSCFSALNTTVSSCPGWLRRHAGYTEASLELVPQEALQVLCETSCLGDLTALKSQVNNACNGSSDVLVPSKIAYPATFIVDRWLYAMGLSSGAEYTDEQICSFCELGLQRKQLASPFGYNKEAAQDFSSLTSSCGVSTYTYATPTAYALNATTTIPYTPTCTASHTVTLEDEESCVSISGQHNVSTFGLINENALAISCNDLSTGRVLCLPRTCQTYQLRIEDTCNTLLTDLGITMAQLLAWNPMINSGCSNLGSWRGCSPDGTVNVGEGNAATTVAPVPTDAQGQSNHRCARWYDVEAGDTCETLTRQFAIPLQDLIFLNPQISNDCSNLWLNTSYCVRPVGDITTYPGYTLPTPTYVFPKPTSAPSYTPVPVPLPTLNPHAPGTWGDCESYANPFHASGNASLDMAACQTWADEGGVDLPKFVSWNPSLTVENCTMDLGLSYCVGRRPFNETLPYEYCFPPNRAFIPDTSAQPGQCGCYIQLRREDQGIFSCTMFASTFNTSTSAIAPLNPWINSTGTDTECTASVFSHLSSTGFVQICIEAPLTPTSTPTSSNPTRRLTILHKMARYRERRRVRGYRNAVRDFTS
ncbi:LysM peptidoglycan-binding domain-containing protein [Aspergillus stella-maris]|uniref:LysM peptidoglycan-binding domain-containing protein n=1 Tax=Aspergillus stella-maris TaxID=1810926 RepID=UPI003CCDE998